MDHHFCNFYIHFSYNSLIISIIYNKLRIYEPAILKNISYNVYLDNQQLIK